MATVLSASAQLKCPHGFPITATAGPALTIGGSAASVSGTLTPACTAPTSDSSKPCTTVTPAGGSATALTVGHQPALLASVLLTSDGYPLPGPNNCTVSAETPAPLTAS